MIQNDFFEEHQASLRLLSACLFHILCFLTCERPKLGLTQLSLGKINIGCDAGVRRGQVSVL